VRAPKLAAIVLVVFGLLILAVTAVATIGEIRSGVITRRPFTPSSPVVANRSVDPREFWTQIVRRAIGVGAISGGLIAFGVYIRRTK
jgi:hypothetical protein